jgi:monofunctional biosynthetic peptidoglycan transglycosylase
VPQRIEPTFEAAPASIAAEPLIAKLTPSAETSGYLRAPWTVRRVARLAGLAVAAYFGVILFLILLYRFVNPTTTTLIAYQWMTGTKIQQEWVPIEDISPNLLRAVVASEDWGFCNHYGVDLDAIEKALEQAGEGKVARGASTISMQVIKNLFLSQSKSYLRKAIEIPLTFVAEGIWPKARMLEIYLNIAEWGPGVFGAEAAARHHFSKPASQLSQREAALLAAALPNPILRDAGDPGTRTARKASVIQSRMRAAGPVADCAMTGRQRTSEAKPDGGSDGPAGWQTTVKKRAGGT